jgi:hypothetical protein
VIYLDDKNIRSYRSFKYDFFVIDYSTKTANSLILNIEDSTNAFNSELNKKVFVVVVLIEHFREVYTFLIGIVICD